MDFIITTKKTDLKNNEANDLTYRYCSLKDEEVISYFV